MDYTIHLCKFCGNTTSGMICGSCRLKPARKELILEQLELEKENKKKGYKISERLFMFNRKSLLEEYNITL